MTAPELWLTEQWGVVEPDGVGNYRTVENGAFVEDLPPDAVALIPLPVAALLGVVRVLDRCDELDANTTNRMRHGGTLAPALITTGEIRALLGVPAPTKESHDAH